MKIMTVNESMVIQKILRGRLAELSSLRASNSHRETSFYGTEKKIIEPVYDVRALDKKCTEIENYLLILETKVKQSNAITKIEVDGPEVTELLAPIV
jgi:hypothetical protein